MTSLCSLEFNINPLNINSPLSLLCAIEFKMLLSFWLSCTFPTATIINITSSSSVVGLFSIAALVCELLISEGIEGESSVIKTTPLRAPFKFTLFIIELACCNALENSGSSSFRFGRLVGFDKLIIESKEDNPFRFQLFLSKVSSKVKWLLSEKVAMVTLLILPNVPSSNTASASSLDIVLKRVNLELSILQPPSTS